MHPWCRFSFGLPIVPRVQSSPRPICSLEWEIMLLILVELTFVGLSSVFLNKTEASYLESGGVCSPTSSMTSVFRNLLYTNEVRSVKEFAISHSQKIFWLTSLPRFKSLIFSSAAFLTLLTIGKSKYLLYPKRYSSCHIGWSMRWLTWRASLSQELGKSLVDVHLRNLWN